MSESLGKKAIKGTAWSFAEKVAAQLVSLIVGIILARILAPEVYGIIAIVNTFITICNVFVVTGFGESLVQKKDANEIDFSTIFFFNLFLSILLYILLYVAAPYITSFYGDGYEELTLIIRIMGLRLILASMNSIQYAKILIDLAFKKYFYVTFVGSFISGIIGIFMAYKGFGVWALVAQNMSSTLINAIMLFWVVKWVPKLIFSLKRSKSLILYGSRILTASVVTTFFNEIENFLIGKLYTPKDLAFYTKGNAYPKLLSNNLSSAIGSSLFSVLTKVQDDHELYRHYISKSIKLVSFLVFPVMCLLAVIADDFVAFILTEKWLPCVPYLRLLCFYFALYPLATINSQCITASGDSKLYSQITLYIRIIGLIVLFVSLRFGISGIIIGKLLVMLIEYIIKCVPVQKKYNYGFLRQLLDMMPQCLCILFTITCIIMLKFFFLNDIHQGVSLFLQIILGIGFYLFICYITKNAQLNYVLGIIFGKFKK